jgi:hypothetical protein
MRSKLSCCFIARFTSSASECKVRLPEGSKERLCSCILLTLENWVVMFTYFDLIFDERFFRILHLKTNIMTNACNYIVHWFSLKAVVFWSL